MLAFKRILGFDVSVSKGKRRVTQQPKAAAPVEAASLEDDEIGAVQPGALDDVLDSDLASTTQTPAAATVRLSAGKSASGPSTLSSVSDTADQMHASVQAVAFLTLAGCALAAIVGVFWVVRAAPAGLWAFTIAGVSLIIIAVFAGLAGKKLLKYVDRIDAFADNAGSKELVRQMTAAKKFWASAMVAVIISLGLAVVSLLAFALAPVEQKSDKKKKKETQAAVLIEKSLV